MISKPLFRSPAIFKNFHELVAAESTRHGGVSPAPYSSLDLGGSTADSMENVTENNKRFFESLGIPFLQVAKSHQVHGCEILKVSEPGRFEGFDALVTNTPNVQLAVTIADCTPILIYDPDKKVVAAIHAGWRGTVQEIVAKTVAALSSNYGTDPAKCLAFIGTCIDECSFEVGEEVARHFDLQHKRLDSASNKYFIDLKLANKSQLIRAGLNSENIEVSPFSTVVNNEDYFSYRYEKGITGRMLATIGIRA